MLRWTTRGYGYFLTITLGGYYLLWGNLQSKPRNSFRNWVFPQSEQGSNGGMYRYNDKREVWQWDWQGMGLQNVLDWVMEKRFSEQRKQHKIVPAILKEMNPVNEVPVLNKFKQKHELVGISLEC